MPRRPHSFTVGGFYHVFNRGVEKRIIFLDDTDRYQFLLALAFYQQVKVHARLSLTDFQLHDRKEPLLYKIHAYCLMDNHFHLLVEEVATEGIRRGLRHALDSYARYFNRKYNRTGSLFQGRFKSVPIQSNEQLIQVARYIFLNRVVAGKEEPLGSYPWNGYREFQSGAQFGLSEQGLLLSFFQGDRKKLQEFVEDHLAYAQSLKEIKDLVFE